MRSYLFIKGSALVYFCSVQIYVYLPSTVMTLDRGASGGRVPSPPVEMLTLMRDDQESEIHLDQLTPSSVARIFSVCINN